MEVINRVISLIEETVGFGVTRNTHLLSDRLGMRAVFLKDGLRV